MSCSGSKCTRCVTRRSLGTDDQRHSVSDVVNSGMMRLIMSSHQYSNKTGFEGRQAPEIKCRRFLSTSNALTTGLTASIIKSCSSSVRTWDRVYADHVSLTTYVNVIRAVIALLLYVRPSVATACWCSLDDNCFCHCLCGSVSECHPPPRQITSAEPSSLWDNRLFYLFSSDRHVRELYGCSSDPWKQIYVTCKLLYEKDAYIVILSKCYW